MKVGSGDMRSLSVRRRGDEMALASLLLGILGIVLSFVLVGAGFALTGLLLGCLHLLNKPHAPKVMAVCGVSLALIALVASVAFATTYRQAKLPPPERLELPVAAHFFLVS